MQKGIEEEKLSHLIQAVCKKLLKNKPTALIAKELGEELQAVEKVITAQRQVGSYDVKKIFGVMRTD